MLTVELIWYKWHRVSQLPRWAQEFISELIMLAPGEVRMCRHCGSPYVEGYLCGCGKEQQEGEKS